MQAKRSQRWAGASALVLCLTAAAQAEPAVAGLASRIGPVDAAAQAAFKAGAMPQRKADTAALDRALSALEAGEAAYLSMNLRGAEKSLTAAFDGLLGALDVLDDAEPAVRAGLLLVQVQLARKRRSAAEQTVDRAVLALPGFPAGGQPPPDVQPIILAARKRLAGQLNARLSVKVVPAGAYVRLNGVPVGRAPLTVEGLAPGRVRVSVQSGRQGVARMITLKSGGQAVRLQTRPSPEQARAVLAALKAGRPVFKAAADLQAAQGADTVCAGLIVPQRGVYIMRLNGPGSTVIGAYRTPRPSTPQDWRALGRFCRAKAPTNTRPAEVRAILRGGSQQARPTPSDNSGLGWSLVVGSGAALAAGVYFGLQANDFADAYNTRGRSRDKNDAVRSAAFADTGYVLSAGLLAAGVYLLSD